MPTLICDFFFISGTTEKQLLSLFEGHVKFSLLYKGSLHGFSVSDIFQKSINQGCIMMVGYLADDVIVGGCTSQWLRDHYAAFKDEKAFYFYIEQSELDRTSVKSITANINMINFENGLKFHLSQIRKAGPGHCGQTSLVFLFISDPHPLLSSCRIRDQLKNSIINYKPPLNLVSKTKVLLVGPVGAGKSSFISSVGSVFHGWVALRAMVGSTTQSFTNMFRSYNIKTSQAGEQNPLVLCDMMGLGEEDLPGVKVNNVLQAVKGHVPEGYKVSSRWLSSSRLVEFITLRVPHFLYFWNFSDVYLLLKPHPHFYLGNRVRAGGTVSSRGPASLLCRLSNYLTKVTAAGNLLGLPVSCIVPVRNYSSELELDCSTDILILNALELILRYADLFYEDYDFFKAIQ
uniref:Interferon-induced protein 44-like n=1 Tax=Erpetoichthys calabaricus TaxID=27687 RepID=A0A8C4SWZ7_ERPCA